MKSEVEVESVLYAIEINDREGKTRKIKGLIKDYLKGEQTAKAQYVDEKKQKIGLEKQILWKKTEDIKTVQTEGGKEKGQITQNINRAYTYIYSYLLLL